MKKQRRHTNRPNNQLARRRLSAVRRSTSRGLFAEQLEDRRLLASDFPYHNDLVPMDVTLDWTLSPRDALAVINELNAGGSKSWIRVMYAIRTAERGFKQRQRAQSARRVACDQRAE